AQCDTFHYFSLIFTHYMSISSRIQILLQEAGAGFSPMYEGPSHKRGGTPYSEHAGFPRNRKNGQKTPYIPHSVIHPAGQEVEKRGRPGL
ncbi:hypothetical protein, partial [Heyndrickxia coagulans]|uniref:hypothetical protein n=1 Tax=Heyndrickxia coagulans TaxID=1398 RepID=UPI002E1AF0C5|nr:hypothetical protein [Heyndrickxia coagulans]